jgi:fimbrial chaperone protein
VTPFSRSPLAAAAALALVLAMPDAAPALGRFDVKPIIVNFAPGATSASVEFTNAGAAAQELEIGVDAWTSSDSSDPGQPTDDIIASPSIFTIAPGQTQLVRLGPVRDLTGDVEHTYRLVATEIPPPNPTGTVQTILRMRLPVFVAPHTIAALPLTWHVVRTDPGRLLVRATNDGNVHQRIRLLRVTSGSRVLFDAVVAAYVLARQSRDWSIPLKAGDGAGPIAVHASEMNGATEDATFPVR